MHAFIEDPAPARGTRQKSNSTNNHLPNLIRKTQSKGGVELEWMDGYTRANSELEHLSIHPSTQQQLSFSPSFSPPPKSSLSAL